MKISPETNEIEYFDIDEVGLAIDERIHWLKAIGSALIALPIVYAVIYLMLVAAYTLK